MESKASKTSRRVFGAPAGYRPSPSTADAAPIETLYVHPNVRIVSFTAPVASLSPSVDAARLESGTLASSSRLERTIAVGSFRIYRAPGSVAFLSCGSALQPILPKSQCWCVDEDNTRFVLQIRRPNFWRIELPASTEEYKRQAADLRKVFDVILQFEKTHCPFQRGFTVELPDEAFVPVKRKAWKPKHSPVGHDSPDSSPQTICEESGRVSGRYGGHGDAARGDAAIAWRGESPAAPESRVPFHRSDTSLEREAPYTGADYATLRLSPRPEVPGHSVPLDDVDSLRRRGSDTVAAIIHDFNTRLAGHEAYGTQETAMRSSPSLEALTLGTSNPGVQGGTFTRSSVRVEVAAPNNPSDTERPSRSSSQDSFQSICSWHSLSNSGFPSSTGTTARAASQEGCNVDHCQNFDSLRADSAAAVSIANAERVRAQEPHSSLEASTGSLAPIDHIDTGDVGIEGASQSMPTGVRSPSPLPPASNIARPSDADHSRPSDPLGKPNGLPMTIMAKAYEALLAPPAHLIVLMMKVAARLSAGEWRGNVYGYNNNGGQIPVHWDYSEDDLSD